MAGADGTETPVLSCSNSLTHACLGSTKLDDRLATKFPAGRLYCRLAKVPADSPLSQDDDLERWGDYECLSKKILPLARLDILATVLSVEALRMVKEHYKYIYYTQGFVIISKKTNGPSIRCIACIGRIITVIWLRSTLRYLVLYPYSCGFNFFQCIHSLQSMLQFSMTRRCIP